MTFLSEELEFSKVYNASFLKACTGQSTSHTPIWLMRQAGRYLPQYCATRAKAGSFMGLAMNKDFATEVTLQPLACYDLDAAILFSDILTVPDAMGLGLSFTQGEGPKFANPVCDETAVKALRAPDLDKLRYVFDAVGSIRQALTLSDGKSKVPLIGFSGSAWTLACYMVEGCGSSDYRVVKTMLYQRPDLMHRILEVNATGIVAYLNAQIEAGAQAVMIFDSWGGVLSDKAFHEFSLSYTQKILSQLKRSHDGAYIPRIVFTKGGGLWLEAMSAKLECDVLGVDWCVNLAKARQTVLKVSEDLRQNPKALQGNLDPNVLFANPKQIEQEAIQVLESFGAPHLDSKRQGSTHIFNLGHGISQYTPPSHVKILVDIVHEHSRKMRS